MWQSKMDKALSDFKKKMAEADSSYESDLKTEEKEQQQSLTQKDLSYKQELAAEEKKFKQLKKIHD